MIPRPVLACVLGAVLLSGCAAGAEDEQDTAAAPAASSAAPSASPSTVASPVQPTSPPAALPSPSVRTVAVSYAGGQVTGTDGREEVPVGEEVVLRLTSDVAEQVHVHGYDLEADLPAGVPVEIPVTATIPGVFEVELHESGKVLFQLRVS